MILPTTPTQTVGPFFHYALLHDGRAGLVRADDPAAIRIGGAVLDGAGEPVLDAMVETWQASRSGRYAHPEDTREQLPLEPGSIGFQRVATDAEGRYELLTVKPGPVPGPGGRLQAPHIALALFARGLLRQLVTRIYFPDEEDANAEDPVLCSIAEPERRSLLVAHPESGMLRFDIHLQGDVETPFFDV